MIADGLDADFARRRSFDHSPDRAGVRAQVQRPEHLHFDAHPDIYENYQGNRNSHASPFARIMEEKLVKRLVQVGIRTFTAHQREQVEKFGVESIEMRNLIGNLQLEFDSPVYISFDIDALRSGVCAWRVASRARWIIDAAGDRSDSTAERESRWRRHRRVQSTHGSASHHRHRLRKALQRDRGKNAGVNGDGKIGFYPCHPRLLSLLMGTYSRVLFQVDLPRSRDLLILILEQLDPLREPA